MLIQEHLVLHHPKTSLSVSLSLKHTHFYTFLIHSQHTYLTLYALYTLDALGLAVAAYLMPGRLIRGILPFLQL